MKNKKINIKTITIIVLIGIIIILINLNIKNTNILQQEIAKEQLAETTSNNAYVEMQTHLSEINEQEEKLLSFKTKIAEAITNKGIETSADDTADTMANNINSIINASNMKVLTSGGGSTGHRTVTYTITSEDNIKNVIVVVASSNNVIASGAIASCYTNNRLTCESIFQKQNSFSDSEGDGVQRTAVYLIKDIPVGEIISISTRWMGHYCIIGY